MKMSFDIIAAHCLNTLPESVPARLKLVKALLNHMRPEHPMFVRVNALISLMDEQERLQGELWHGFSGVAVPGGRE